MLLKRVGLQVINLSALFTAYIFKIIRLTLAHTQLRYQYVYH